MDYKAKEVQINGDDVKLQVFIAFMMRSNNVYVYIKLPVFIHEGLGYSGTGKVPQHDFSILRESTGEKALANRLLESTVSILTSFFNDVTCRELWWCLMLAIGNLLRTWAAGSKK